MHNPCNRAQVKGGPETYEDGKECKAAEIVAMRPSRAGIQYRITWAGYDQTYDTWEPRENVLDSRLIKDFETTLELSIPLQQPMGQLREAVAKALTAMKHPMQGMCVDVPLAL